MHASASRVCSVQCSGTGSRSFFHAAPRSALTGEQMSMWNNTLSEKNLHATLSDCGAAGCRASRGRGGGACMCADTGRSDCSRGSGKDMSDRGAQGTGYEERSQLVTRASLMLTVAVQEFAGLPAARCPCCFALSIVDSITAGCRTWRMSRSCRDCLEPSWRGNGCAMD